MIKLRYIKERPNWLTFAIIISGLYSLLIILSIPLNYIAGSEYAMYFWSLLTQPGLFLFEYFPLFTTSVAKEYVFFLAGITSIVSSFIAGILLSLLLDLLLRRE